MTNPAGGPAAKPLRPYWVGIAGIARRPKYLVLLSGDRAPDAPAALIGEIEAPMRHLHLSETNLPRPLEVHLPEGRAAVTLMPDPLELVPGEGLGAPMRRLLKWLDGEPGLARADFNRLLARKLMPPAASGYTPSTVDVASELMLSFRLHDTPARPEARPRRRPHDIWI